MRRADTAVATSGALELAIATLCGAAVGLERQWSGHAEGAHARFAGLRTFTILGAIGGCSGLLWTSGATALAAILFAGAMAIVVSAYLAGSRDDIDGTTEVAALVVLAAGVLTAVGFVRIASGGIALTTLLLIEKPRLHALARRLDDVGFRSGVRFAVMALVIMPLLPEGPFGPAPGLSPRTLWAMVLFFSGLGFAGYVARRLVGRDRGDVLAGLLGGLVSSTNVTFVFARNSRAEPASARQLAWGAVAANAMLYPRVLAATVFLGPAVTPHLAWLLAGPALVAALPLLLPTRRRSASTSGEPPGNPLQLVPALQTAALFQVVLVSVHVIRQWWGASGVVVTAGVLGLTDVDALTVSMTREVAGALSPETAALGITVGVLANTVMKLVVTLALGERRFVVRAGGMLLLQLTALACSLVGWQWWFREP
jgi:uncharacterized membrane protein (DUF4010 family)